MQYPEVEMQRVPDALSWGFTFALSHFRLLFLLMLLPLAVDAAATYLQFAFPLAKGDIFLLLVVSLLINAWLLQAVLAFCIEYMQGKNPDVLTLLGNGWLQLPKVFFSYVALAVSVLLLASSPFLLIFALFFVWAPFFCSGELYAIALPPGKAGDEEISDEVWMDHEPEVKTLTRKRFFSEMAVWNLGLLRSLDLSRYHLVATIQVVTALWFSHMVPIAVVEFFVDSKNNFLLLLIMLSFSSAVQVVVLAAAAGIFLMLLPREGRQELGISDYVEPSNISPNNYFLACFRLRNIVFSLMLIACCLSTLFLFDKSREEALFPASVKVELLSAQPSQGRLAIKLRLVDLESHFRWLDLDAFRLSLSPATAQSLKDKNLPDQAVNSSVTSKAEENKAALLKFDRIIVQREDNTPLERDAFVPHYGPLVIWFYITFPGGENTEQGNFSLMYDAAGADKPTLVYQGVYGVDQGHG